MAGFANKRAEIWGFLREWLTGGMLPNDPELRADLVGPQYGFTLRDGREVVILEKKDDMKSRGLASPDIADALALTFAYPVQPSDHTRRIAGKPQHEYEHDPMAEAYRAGRTPPGQGSQRWRSYRAWQGQGHRVEYDPSGWDRR